MLLSLGFIEEKQAKINRHLRSSVEIATILRDKRIQMGLTQENIADLIGMDRRAVQRAEDSPNVKLSVVASICIVLDISLQELCFK